MIMISRHPLFLIAGASIALALKIMSTTILWSDHMKKTTGVLSSESHYSRQLRFFDPNHNICGQSQARHEFAVHCLYGAKLIQYPDYYKRKTISTDRDFKPTDMFEVEKVIRVLSYIARKTGRAIRVKKYVILADDVHEHLQPYSMVDAEALIEIGVPVVEPLFWPRADGTMELKTGRRHEYQVIELGSGDAALEKLQWAADDESKSGLTPEELKFKIDELMDLDIDAVGALTGEEGGYVNGRWKSFICGEAVETSSVEE